MNINDVAKVWLTDNAICVQLNNGEIGTEFFKDYSRLQNANPTQKANYKLSHFGIHWPDIDEDLSYQGFFSKS